MSYNNIVLIVADTLRAKNLPSYGAEIETTDFLSKQRSVDNYYSNSPWTVPAHASLFSGKLPAEHGTTTKNTYFSEENDIVRKYNENGYETVGITENGLLDQSLGFGKNFDSFGSPPQWYYEAESWNEVWRKDESYSGRLDKYTNFLNLLAQNKDLVSIKAGLNKIRTTFKEDYNPTGSQLSIKNGLRVLNQNNKTFLFMNLMAIHAPYTFNIEQKENFLPKMSEEEIAEVTGFDTLKEYLDADITDRKLFSNREKAYNASINYFDSLVEKIYEKAPDNTLFVVVGDHGELMGEYEINGVNLIDHHFGTFKELVEVPLYLFSKGSDVEIQIQDGLHDHLSLHDFLKNLAEEDSTVLKSKKLVRSEYFGKIEFDKQFDRVTPQEYTDLFERKSFSLIDEEYKYDYTSDGEFLWFQDRVSEDSLLESSKLPEKLSEKGEILYQWRFD